MTGTSANTAHTQLGAALESLRNPDGGWPYYRGRRSRIEPTCWALMATGARFDSTPLASWINEDGLLVEPATPHANYAFNGLAALAMGSNAPPALLARLIMGLIAVRGEAIAANPAIRLDSSLQGWSWLASTFSWVEPTSWCMLALKRHGNTANAVARISVGERILRDRVCADGGWNYGNSEVFEQQLPGHVPPTAAALLAIQDRPGDPLLQRAASFLAARGPAEGSTTSLALSALALHAVGHDVRELHGRLTAHVPEALAFGNAATIAMAVLALATPSRQRVLHLQSGSA